MTELLAEALEKRFGPVLAVSDVSLRVSASEVVGLLGPNGAGKTTTLRMLAGILPPTRGRVFVGGLDVQRHPLEARAGIGFLSGDTQLYQRLTPREVLRYFGRLYGVEEGRLSARIADLVGELEMSGFADRPCGTLSSGQKQRANIARAFLHEPDVLILDEPTVALDIISGQFIVESIRRQRGGREGRAVLHAHHERGGVPLRPDPAAARGTDHRRGDSRRTVGAHRIAQSHGRVPPAHLPDRLTRRTEIATSRVRSPCALPSS